MIEVFKDGSWVEQAPVEGDKFREVINGFVMRESYWAEMKPRVIRKITKRAFLQRFTQAERIAVRNSTDDIVIDIYEDLKIAEFVDLDLDATSQGLAYLEAVGILEVGRTVDLLADGVPQEV